ncbi:MAG: phospholipase D-like domain-containing protein [Bdellovibrionota bacterium]
MGLQFILQQWVSEEIFYSGDEFFRHLEFDIGAAKDSIDLETYIFENDQLGVHILALLSKATQRGVTVRVMADGVGSSNWGIKLVYDADKLGVETRVFHPIPWLLGSYFLWAEARGKRGILRLLNTVNRRNHRKVCVIDKRVAYVGGMNVSSWHLLEAHGDKAWRDTGARVEGWAVAHLTAAFEKAWRDARGIKRSLKKIWVSRKHRLVERIDAVKRRLAFLPQRTPAEHKLRILVRLNDSRIRRRRYYIDLLYRIVRSRNRIWITNPYFVPHGSLLRALRVAAKSGVDVRVLVPRKSDVFFMRWVTAAFYGSLLRSGARLYEYLPSVLHAKTILIDEWATVGSTNLNYRSLFHDLEVDVVLTSAESLKSVEEQFLKDLEKSHEVTITDWRRLGLLGRFGGRIALLFRYWI